MRVLVLGGTAWLGAEVARQAHTAGHDVTCLARGESGAAPSGVRWVRADRSSPDAYTAVADEDFDIVVDVTRQPGHARGAVAALGERAGHWTLISTANVYADLGDALDEESPVRAPLAADVADPSMYGEGKVACEQAVAGLPRHLLLRVGLIVGPGDPSDRGGSWVARCASAAGGDVLVPDLVDARAQLVDVRDVAAFVLAAAGAGTTGVLNVAGEATSVTDVVALSADVAGHKGALVAATPDWLVAHDVAPWSGERSLPLWLPAGYEGMARMSVARAEAAGLTRRLLRATLTDVLADERARGLDRRRGAGLARGEELALLAAL